MTLYSILLLVLTGAGALGCIVFVIDYHIRTGGRWRHQEAGRFLMIVYLNLGALFTLIVVNQAVGQWYGRQTFTLTLFAAYCFFAWWPLRLLHKYNKRPDRKEGDD